jgi:hypothetical protein
VGRHWLPSGVRSALRALAAEPVPAVLHPVPPSGVAAGHRAGGAGAAAGAARATATSDGPRSGALSWLTRVVADSAAASGWIVPRWRKGRLGSATALGPSLPSSDSPPNGDRVMDRRVRPGWARGESSKRRSAPPASRDIVCATHPAPNCSRSSPRLRPTGRRARRSRHPAREQMTHAATCALAPLARKRRIHPDLNRHY